MPVPLDTRIQQDLKAIEQLSDDERQTIASLGLPLYESVVIGYLRAACHLLDRDAGWSVAFRDETWATWQAGITAAIEGTMRFRENAPLVMAIGVLGALLPGVYSQATLRGFKALDDALVTAQRSATALKRERRRQWMRLRDAIRRIDVWVGPAGDILPNEPLTAEQRTELTEHGYQNVWGVQIDYHQPEGVVWLVRAVLPVVAQPGSGGTLIAPKGVTG